MKPVVRQRRDKIIEKIFVLLFLNIIILALTLLSAFFTLLFILNTPSGLSGIYVIWWLYLPIAIGGIIWALLLLLIVIIFYKEAMQDE